MTVVVEEEEERIVLVGIRFDDQIRELLNWALVKVANPGDSVIALHICRNSDSISKAQTLLDGYLDDYEGICDQKQVRLSAGVVRGRRSSVRKILAREGKSRAAIAVLVGINKHNPLGRKVSVAKYCARRLQLSTQVMAVHNGKVFYQRFSGDRIFGSFGDPKPSLRFIGGTISTESQSQSEYGDSETTTTTTTTDVTAGRFSSSQDASLMDYEFAAEKKDDKFLIRRKRSSLSSISLPVEDFTQQRPGWPLLQTTSRITAPSVEARKLSVVQWVLSLPKRSSSEEVPRSSSRSQLFDESDNGYVGGLMGYFAGNYKPVPSDLPEHLELLLRTKPTICKAFSYEIVRKATSQFSSVNLVGKGGWNRVYRGVLPDGKTVAVKISKSSKETWKEFFREVDMLTTLNHRNIVSIVGICVADKDLISVFDYQSKGNLEQNLHGNHNHHHQNPKFVLPWEVRFNIAVSIAEALNHLHNDCSAPIIHRDVKSSNILLNDRFEAQLSDFGLSIWGPSRDSFITDRNVVGTFGYLAPEYFMYGKVSDKIDVYSFGVVLLELVSGRAPISYEKTNSKSQKSLIMWAKPKLESNDFRSILDENLEKSTNVNQEQLERMVLAAKLCLTQAARLRPNIKQILKLLVTGEREKETKPEIPEGEEYKQKGYDEEEEEEDDEVYPDSIAAESHQNLAFSDVNDNSSSLSFSSMDQSSPNFGEDDDGYIMGR